MNHGSRLSGSGIAPRACIPIAIASYSTWSVFAQSRYSDATVSVNMIAEHRRVAGQVVGEALRVEERPEPGLDRARRSR